mgnify:CR=1 FL=1
MLGAALADVGGVGVADRALAGGRAEAGRERVAAGDLDALCRLRADVDVRDVVDPQRRREVVGEHRIADRGRGVDQSAGAQQREDLRVGGLAAGDPAQDIAGGVVEALVEHPGHVVPAGGVVEVLAEVGILTRRKVACI